jgi:putative phage-type endonuclease
MGERTEWLGWRRGGIGGSDVAALMGLSPWSSPWKVWADKCGLLPLDDELDDDDPREAGRWLEDAIARWFAFRYDLTVVGEQTRCTHPEHPHHRCTVDGFVFPGHPGPVFLDEAHEVLEVKHEAYGKPWDDIPAHYQCQGQWQMYVTGTERVHFAVLHGRRLRRYVLERDDDDIALMVAAVDTFWHDHVLTGEPPPVDGSAATADAIAAVYPGDDTEPVELDPHLLEDWAKTKAMVRMDERELATIEQELKVALGDHVVGQIDGLDAVTWKPQTRRGALDEDLLRAAYLDPDEYRKPATTYRVLRAVAQKGQP